MVKLLRSLGGGGGGVGGGGGGGGGGGKKKKEEEREEGRGGEERGRRERLYLRLQSFSVWIGSGKAPLDISGAHSISFRRQSSKSSDCTEE